MSKPANEPAARRPPVTADVAPPGAVTELETLPETKIGRFKLPTDSLRAYSMLLALVVIWLFFQLMTRDAHNPYGLFLNPINFSKLLQQMAVTGVLSPELRRATPSIMCGFALSFALILAIYVTPLYAREADAAKTAA